MAPTNSAGRPHRHSDRLTVSGTFVKRPSYPEAAKSPDIPTWASEILPRWHSGAFLSKPTLYAEKQPSDRPAGTIIAHQVCNRVIDDARVSRIGQIELRIEARPIGLT